MAPLDSLSPQATHVRASDQEREQVAQALRDHHAQGRLDTDELQERLGGCYSAKTIGELDRLLVDLPRALARGRGRPPSPAHWWRPALIAVAVLWALSVAGWHHHAHPGFPFAAALVLLAVLVARRIWFRASSLTPRARR